MNIDKHFWRKKEFDDQIEYCRNRPINCDCI